MYLIIGRFSESVEGIKILQCEDERDLQEILHDPPDFMGTPTYRDRKQWENMLAEAEWNEQMEEEPYYWNVGETVIIKGDVLSHETRLKIQSMLPQSASDIRKELGEKA